MRHRRTSGGLESEVLAALWAADAPMTPGDVALALDAGLAYTTVQTILTRLHVKGVVARERIGRAHAYSPVLDEAGLAATRMHAMLDRGGDHAAVLSRFVSILSAQEEHTLALLLGVSAADSAHHVASSEHGSTGTSSGAVSSGSGSSEPGLHGQHDAERAAPL